MSWVLITGSSGLVGSEAVRYFSEKGQKVVGLDNDMRRYFFGDGASTSHITKQLRNEYPYTFTHHSADIRKTGHVDELFDMYKPELVIHAAAQPAHDWAAKEPLTDFHVNAVGTSNLLEAHRRHVPESTFVYCSTSKVYGDNPNRLPLTVDEGEQRYDLPPGHRYLKGIDTSMSIDLCTHSLFGASKAAADLLVQEYGRYFDIPTVCFRPGCISGANHQGAKLHGFLSYMMRCCMTGEPYTVIGYGGYQVRCNINAKHLVEAFDLFHEDPTPGSVYNIGGGRGGSCSMWEAIDYCELIAERKLNWTYEREPRIGDHRWWISDNVPFMCDYPSWRPRHSVLDVLSEIHETNKDRWHEAA